MVSANIPEQWLTNATILRLSDRAYRHHCMLLTWSVSNRTNGHVPGDIPLLQIGITNDGLQEVAKAGLLEANGDGWVLTQYEQTQSSAEQISSALDNLRSGARDRKRKSRAKQRDARESADGHVTVTGRSESKEKQSKAEQRKASEDVSTSESAEIVDWDVASIPDGEDAGLEQADMDTGELAEPALYCRRFGCSEPAMSGAPVCAVHAERRYRRDAA